jgi:hypothetical protein
VFITPHPDDRLAKKYSAIERRAAKEQQRRSTTRKASLETDDECAPSTQWLGGWEHEHHATSMQQNKNKSSSPHLTARRARPMTFFNPTVNEPNMSNQ